MKANLLRWEKGIERVLAGLGRSYSIDSLLKDGRNGNGKCSKPYVWKLKDSLGRASVLKCTRSMDKATVERITTEYRVLFNSNHCNIVEVYEFISSRGFTGFRMEYLPRLAVLGNKTPIDEEEAIKIAVAIGKALRHVHNKRWVHQDFNGGNIGRTVQNGQRKEGKVKLFDFEYACRIGKENQYMYFGTPRYTAPEQVKEGKVIDQRTDLFKLGIYLCELLTGKHPCGAFLIQDRENPCNEYRWVQEQAPQRHPCELNPALSESLGDLVYRMFQYDKKERFQDAGEVIGKLERHAKREKTRKIMVRKARRIGSQSEVSIEYFGSQTSK